MLEIGIPMIFIFCGILFLIAIVSTINYGVKASKRKKNSLINLSSEEREKIKMYLNSINNIDKVRNANKVLSFFIIVILIALLSLFAVSIINKERLPIGYFVVTVIVMVIICVILGIVNSKYTKEYKQKVIKSIIYDCDHNLLYCPNFGMDEAIYRNSNLDHYDRYHSEDLVKGTIEGLEFMMSDIHTEDENTDSEGHTTTTTSFLGSFAYVDLNKNIGSNIYITSTGADLFQGNKVLMDNENFSKVFSVYSKDKVTALRILTPDVTNIIIDLYNKCFIDMEVSIQGSKLYFKLYTGNLFEPCIGNEEKEIQNIYLYKYMLINIEEIVKEIVKVLNELEV